MKTYLQKIMMLCLMLTAVYATGQTIAVAPFKTYGLMTDNEAVTRMAQLEVIKLNKYAVLDQFDINELVESTKYDSCFGKTCLVEYGNALGTDLILSGNVDGLGNKIVVSMKLIDVKKSELIKNHSLEFDNQEAELQRMMGIVLEEMHGITPDAETMKRLAFKNEVITSDNVGQIKNSGPRMGIAYTTGSVNEFVTRSSQQGGLEIQPVMSNLGYQFEAQYIGTEKFSALFECLVMFSGLEQGKFIPSVSFLNGYRFGKSGWEFAFGPSFSLSKTSNGFFDTQGVYGTAGRYWSDDDFAAEGHDVNSLAEHEYELKTTLDTRGDLVLSTRWLVGFGRTFRSGALNVPVNLFYSSQKGGGMLGVSVGFNIIRAKKSINKTN